jgi:hypothetical protein
MTIKNILVNEFVKQACPCPSHLEYNRGIRDEGITIANACKSKCIASTIAKIIFDQHIQEKLLDDPEVTIADLNEECKSSINSLKNTRTPENNISLWIIDEYTMVSPSKMYILWTLARAVNSKVFIMICGDPNQCGPIGFSNQNDRDIQIDVNPQSEEFLYMPITTDLKALANCIIPSDHIYEYSLKTLVRSEGDKNLQQFLLDFDQLNRENNEENIKLKNIQTFVGKQQIKSDGIINLDSYIKAYESFITKRENGNMNVKPPTLFKILVKTNRECYELVESFVKNVYSALSEIFDPSVLKKYITSYPTTSTTDYGYLMVGCKYKLIYNVSKPLLVNSTMMTLKSINWHKHENYISSVIMETIETKDETEFMPVAKNCDRRMDNVHVGFPFHMVIVENAFQSQGLTIVEDGYLNMRSCTSQEQYVMLSRFKNLSQVKNIINC